MYNKRFMYNIRFNPWKSLYYIHMHWWRKVTFLTQTAVVWLATYLTSPEDNPILHEAVVCFSHVVFPIFNFFSPHADCNWSKIIINSKIILMVYGWKTRISICVYNIYINCYNSCISTHSVWKIFLKGYNINSKDCVYWIMLKM